VVFVNKLKLEAPIRTSSRANLFTETQEIMVEKTVRNVKSTTTKMRIGPPEEISIDSPFAEVLNTRDTK
jgi:hypothetical protein